MTDAAEAIVVIAPHPDDELLGAGGLMARALEGGARLAVIYATDGARSDPGVPAETLRQIRRTEACEGLISLLGALPPVVFLDYEDGTLDARDVDLGATSPLAQFLSPFADACILVTDPSDAHPDHKAAFGLASRLVTTGLAGQLAVMPVSQRIDGRFDSHRYERHALGAYGPRKAAALACHKSQLQSEDGFVLTKTVQEMFAAAEYTRLVHDGHPKAADAAALACAHFERINRRRCEASDDQLSAYEHDRCKLTMELLEGANFARAIEFGCSNGTLTPQLAAKCDHVFAADFSHSALSAARKQTGLRQNVAFMHMNEPAVLPEGRFDLIILGDITYCFGLHGIAQVFERLPHSAAPGCRVVITGYLGDTGSALTGEMAVQTALAHAAGWKKIKGSRSDRVRLDMLALA